jgi:hypothetical protein
VGRGSVSFRSVMFPSVCLRGVTHHMLSPIALRLKCGRLRAVIMFFGVMAGLLRLEWRFLWSMFTHPARWGKARAVEFAYCAAAIYGEKQGVRLR